MTDLIQQVGKTIVLIDGYVDIMTRNILAKKKDGVDVAGKRCFGINKIEDIGVINDLLQRVVLTIELQSETLEINKISLT